MQLVTLLLGTSCQQVLLSSQPPIASISSVPAPQLSGRLCQSPSSQEGCASPPALRQALPVSQLSGRLCQSPSSQAGFASLPALRQALPVSQLPGSLCQSPSSQAGFASLSDQVGCAGPQALDLYQSP